MKVSNAIECLRVELVSSDTETFSLSADTAGKALMDGRFNSVLILVSILWVAVTEDFRIFGLV